MTATLMPLQPRVKQPPTVHPGDLIAQLLREQQELSAVEAFAAWHEHRAPSGLDAHYSRLIPITAPGPGQQLGFDVDLDRCSGCKACVVACHSLNGLDDDESFRDVGLLSGTGAAGPLLQHVTTACHHCLDPGCLNACPVNAYEKDPVTGIVHHLDDQCFGCQYCTLACPYQVPKYHSGKGIVRKCDMCSQRLKAGEAPACVQACPHEAISIRIVDSAEVQTVAARGEFLPDSPNPAITIPTTRFRGGAVRDLALSAAPYATPVLQPAHWPLIVLLVLSQIAVGIVACVCVARWMGFAFTKETALLAIAAALAVVAAMSSTLHLGRPWLAYRAVLGIGHSWLSREIVAFGAFIPLLGSAIVLSWLESRWVSFVLPAALTCGIAGVAASVMIYHVTGRPCWHASRTIVSFATALMSIAPLVVVVIEQATVSDAGMLARSLGIIALAAMLVNVLCDCRTRARTCHRHQADETITSTSPAALSTNANQRHATAWRLTAPALTLLIILVPAMPLAIGALFAATVAELIERYHFFRLAVPLRMPGVSQG